ncbi:M20/M25/M40 family metallo-hydrolase [Saccharopolyspora sp. HNM0983]|uniref:M20/M25/M40 family metallo-hydrolase n=1 Tax=Saccharopolyspora montiporae TaxID=2781240 RepID=A0A929B7M6_9PSEU|nr:M20/M25/M40 family metallo-hydrolase [Saccharopolyspora sp. HNM0983]MBE9373695.1 M20/M25/M40 family metallo-hydrolase [Saccharopolyspora sp. HNM0983]
MTREVFTDRDRRLLLDLLRTPTVSPLESGTASEMPGAQHTYATAAHEAGLHVVQHAAPPAECLAAGAVPSTVRAAGEGDPGFLSGQPSLVLRLGAECPRENTAMFNVHLDTVDGAVPVGFDGRRITGRGAVDAKGPAVALLAGIRHAARTEPALGGEVGVLVQAVAGEEGGAMGTYGTRPLVQQGWFGRLNVFCEPTGLRALRRVTASATARIRVDGAGAVDDHPDRGDNATVLLGFLAQQLAAALDSADRPGRTCIAGLRTGDTHNRVHGTGQLLINLSYTGSAEGAAVERDLTEQLDKALVEFATRFGTSREFARTARNARDITRLDWIKRGLPGLDCTDPLATRLCAAAGIEPWPADEPGFTCDAIWMDGVPDAATIVLGPGSLDANNAHAAGEHVHLHQLNAFASAVSRLLVEFAREHRPVPEETAS